MRNIRVYEGREAVAFWWNYYALGIVAHCHHAEQLEFDDSALTKAIARFTEAWLKLDEHGQAEWSWPEDQGWIDHSVLAIREYMKGVREAEGDNCPCFSASQTLTASGRERISLEWVGTATPSRCLAIEIRFRGFFGPSVTVEWDYGIRDGEELEQSSFLSFPFWLDPANWPKQLIGLNWRAIKL